MPILNKTKRKLLLVILDGWGINPKTQGNAIALGNTPIFDKIIKEHPYTELVSLTQFQSV